jgi:adenylate kinase family enzyme
MAPEPYATQAVLAVINKQENWVLDGFPRSINQLNGVRYTPIIYLAVTRLQAMRRAKIRARMPLEVEIHRIQEQTILLAPVKAMAACVIQTGFRTVDEVFRAAVDWLELEKQPRDTP